MAVTRRRTAATATGRSGGGGGLDSLVPTLLRRSSTSTSSSSRSTSKSTSSSSSPAFVVDAWTFLLAFVAIAHLAAAPFTKVEESFGMQAVHDLMFLGPRRVKEFDHAMFPGVVPRTFLAPAAVAALAAVPTFAALRLRVFATAKLAGGIFTRATLAMLSIAALSRLRGAVERAASSPSSSPSPSSSKKRGKRVSAFLALLTALQFHLPFYLSRTLPNTFATVVTTLALADWIDGTRPRRALALLAAAAAALRCDVLLLAAAVGLHVLLVARTLPLATALAASLAGGIGAAAASVAFDSHFWGRGALSEPASRKFGWAKSRLVWPELMVLLFNAPSSSSSSSGKGEVISSASSEWGVSPWHWYLTSALPRGLGVAGVLGVFWAVFLSPSPLSPPSSLSSSPSSSSSKSESHKRIKKNDDKNDNKKVLVVSARHAAAVAAGFVALYSLLPHKELRFLLPVLPLFNVVAAFGLADVWGSGGGEEGDAREDSDGKEKEGEEKASAKKKKNSNDTRRQKQQHGLRRGGRGLLGLLLFPAGNAAGAGFLLALAARCLVAAALAATAATTGLSLAAASKNYPGGAALERLHSLIDREKQGRNGDVRIHIDVAAAQQGITRFGERSSDGDVLTFSSPSSSSSSPSSSPRSYSYSKDESLEPHELASAGFTHLVTEQNSVPDFELVEAVEGFAGLRLVLPSSSSSSSGNNDDDDDGDGGGGENEEELRPSPGALVRALRARKIPRLRLKTEPRIYLHRRRRSEEAEL